MANPSKRSGLKSVPVGAGPEDDADGGKIIDLDVHRAPEFSEEALALRFANQHASRLRYVAKWGTWFIWDGTRWQRDDTVAAFNMARTLCRVAATECNEQKEAKKLASAATVAAVERLARADRRLAATIAQWDADPWLLNTPDGPVNLRSGDMRSHRPDDYLTKSTTVAPNAECSIETWLQFLSRATGKDAELIEYLQRLCGYCLTGDISEHALAFLFGTGANGKSTFLNAITGAMGDYHKTAPIETFTASNTDRHPTDLARLVGARLVTANETEEGRRWAESRTKSLTGGDPIAARFMRQDFFEFEPQFKLLIAGNHKPSLRSVDEAIRRRFNLVPFTVTIPKEQRDPELGDKLKAEWPGILAWCIGGCLTWQQHGGLNPPKAVTDATAAYLESEDALAAWIEESCERDPGAWESSANLFTSWAGWATRCGETVGSSKGFAGKLESKGLIPARSMKARGYTGLRLAGTYHDTTGP
jgi:putative DNA primase/helicase